jgi:hypothetical protein
MFCWPSKVKYDLYNAAFNSLDYVASNGRMNNDDEFEGMGKGAVMGYFKIVSQRFLRKTEEIHENLKHCSRCPDRESN